MRKITLSDEDLYNLLININVESVKDSGDWFTFRCPWHSDKVNSAGINKESLFINCFAPNCEIYQVTTDIYDLIKQQLDFENRSAAIKWFRDTYYIDEDNFIIDPESIKPIIEKLPVTYDIIENELNAVKWAKKRNHYLYERCLNDKVLNFFCVGWNPVKGVITIPIRDFYGNIIFFKERKPFLKTYFNKRGVAKNNILFGLDKAYKHGFTKVYIVEGEIDCMSLWQSGIPAVAIMGSYLSDLQVKELKRAKIDTVVLMPDNDKPGRELLKQMIGALGYSFNTLIAVYPSAEYKDANDLLRAGKINEVKEITYLEYLLAEGGK